MAKRHGRDSVFQIEDSGGNLRSFGTGTNNAIDNVSAPQNVDEADVAGFGDTSHHSVLGLVNTPVGLSGPFDDAVTTGIHPVLSGLLRGTGISGSAGYDFRYLPSGTATGLPRLRGRVLVTTYQVTSPVGGRVDWSANLVPAIAAGLVWETVP